MNDSWQHTLVTASRPVRWAAAAALTLLALFLLVKTVDALGRIGETTNPPTNVITVTGDGHATAAPDVATIDFSVMQNAKDVATAQSAATKQTNDALAAVKAEGVADKDVRTLSYNVSPQYDYRNPCSAGIACPQIVSSNPTVIGYQVSEMIEVKVHDLSKAGDVLGKLGGLGVQNISGPNLTLDDPTSVQNQARQEAITKARAQAQVLAKQLGVSLGKVVSFSENGNQPYPMIYGLGAAKADTTGSAPSIPTGQNEFTSSVSITYEIH